MGNKITRPRRIFKRISLKPAINVTYINDIKKDESVEEEEYIETIHDANFSWLEGRRVSENSTDSIYLFGRYTEEVNFFLSFLFLFFLFSKISLTIEKRTYINYTSRIICLA